MRLAVIHVVHYTSVLLTPTATSGPESVPGPHLSRRMDCWAILHCEVYVPLHWSWAHHLLYFSRL